MKLVVFLLTVVDGVLIQKVFWDFSQSFDSGWLAGIAVANFVWLIICDMDFSREK